MTATLSTYAPTRTTRLKTDGYQLSKDNVREIRRMYASGIFTQRALASAFGVTQPAIYQAVNYKTYRNV